MLHYPSAAEAGSKILIVEDEAPIRLVWERFMKRWGLSADMAQNGKEGLEKARESPYHVVITDLTMPVLTGQELVYTLKKEQPQLEIIVTTGQGTIEIAVEMMKAGAYDFITKPINFSSAEYIIRKCLEKVEAQEENIRLRQINQDLQEINMIKEKFIAITSHELRTPVSVISNVVQVLVPMITGEEEGPLLHMLSSASKHLTEIVGEMHEISEVNSEKITLKPSRFLLAPLCQEIEEEFALTVQERHHAAGWNIPAELEMSADRGKVKKILRELFQNAIRFTSDGGEIQVDAEGEENGTVVLAISDNGVGIPLEERDKIFHLFYEVGDSMNHHTSFGGYQGGGMGVGLAIVGDMVTAHGGRISVSSEVGKGTRFTVTIPPQQQSDIVAN